MKGPLKFAAMAMLVPALLFGTPVQAANNGAAIIGGLIAGAAIGAAVSGAIKYPKPIYVPAPPPPPPWQQVIVPKPGVNCYVAQQACYFKNGAYAPGWTTQVFGR
jgi:hypothetical protein